MAEIDYSELEDAVVTLENEDGESIDCAMQCIFEYNGQDYAVLAEEDNPEQEVYFFGLDAAENNGKQEFEFSIIEDDELLAELLEVFQQIMDDEFEDEDISEEEDVEDEEDDSIWDQFITKKLDND